MCGQQCVFYVEGSRQNPRTLYRCVLPTSYTRSTLIRLQALFFHSFGLWTQAQLCHCNATVVVASPWSWSSSSSWSFLSINQPQCQFRRRSSSKGADTSFKGRRHNAQHERSRRRDMKAVSRSNKRIQLSCLFFWFVVGGRLVVGKCLSLFYNIVGGHLLVIALWVRAVLGSYYLWRLLHFLTFFFSKKKYCRVPTTS